MTDLSYFDKNVLIDAVLIGFVVISIVNGRIDDDNYTMIIPAQPLKAVSIRDSLATHHIDVRYCEACL